MLPLTINIHNAYANGRDDEQKFIQNLSLFLCTFLKEHGTLVEKKVTRHATNSYDFNTCPNFVVVVLKQFDVNVGHVYCCCTSKSALKQGSLLRVTINNYQNGLLASDVTVSLRKP